MSSKVKGFVQAQNWFQTFSSITMTKQGLTAACESCALPLFEAGLL